MVPLKGWVAALVLPALLAIPPSAVQAQQQHNCSHQNGGPPSGQFQGHSMNSMPPQTSQTSFLSQMSQMCGMRNQMSQTSQMSQISQTPFLSQMSQMCGLRNQSSTSSTSQAQQLQMVAMQQLQMVAMQQMQMVAMQQQMFAMQQMQLVAMRQQQIPLQQSQLGFSPPDLQVGQRPPLDLVQHNQTSALLKEMTTVQKRLDALQEAAQRKDLPATEAMPCSRK